jgi:hypothetical protein
VNIPDIPNNRDEEEERCDDCTSSKCTALLACKGVRALDPINQPALSGQEVKGGRRKEHARDTSNQRMMENMPESRIPRSDMAVTQMRTGRQQQNRGRWKMKWRMPRPMMSSLLRRGGMWVSLGGLGINNEEKESIRQIWAGAARANHRNFGQLGQRGSMRQCTHE